MKPTPEDAQVDIHAQVKALLEAWCDRRMYPAICELYSGYSSLNGLTDGWVLLLESLKRVRNMTRQQNSRITAAESESVAKLIGVISRALNAG